MARLSTAPARALLSLVFTSRLPAKDLEDAFFRMPGTGNTGNGSGQEHDNVMMIGHVNDDPLLEDRAISLPLWGDMAGGENGVNEGNGNGTVAGKNIA